VAKPRRFRAWLFLVTWIIVTGVLLTVPFGKSPQIVERGYDKVIHTSLFTVMGIAAQAAAPFISLLLTIPVAVGLEYVQKEIPARTFSTIDLLANLTGILLGLCSFELSTRLSTR
jgi:hypothetical protein